MNSFTLFVVTLVVVDIALIIALVCWTLLAKKTSSRARVASVLFVICFALYVVGQTAVILDVVGVDINSVFSSYLYALAAILFAIGSVYQLKS